MVDKLQVDNPANAPMHYNHKVDVGELNPSEKLPYVIVYDGHDAKMKYNSITADMYESQKKAKPVKKKFPKILKIAGIVCAAVLAVIFRKNIVNFFKGIPKMFKKSS